MKKTLLTLALLTSTIALGQTAPAPVVITPAVTTADTIPAPAIQLPQLPELQRHVSVTVPVGGLSLEAAITLIARTVGLNILAQDLPHIQLHSGLQNLTAGEALETLLNLYAPGTAATVKGKLLIIGDHSAIERVAGLSSRNQIAQALDVPGLTAEQFGRVQNLLHGQSVYFDTGKIILSGTPAEIKASQTLFHSIEMSENAGATNRNETLTTATYTVTSETVQATSNAIHDLLGANVSSVGNTIVVRTTAQKQAEVQHLITGINQPTSAEGNIKRSYQSVSPSDDKELLEALLDVKVTSLSKQRMIVVQGTLTQQKAVETLLNHRQSLSAATMINYYPINTGKATDLLPALQRELPNAELQVIEGHNIISVQAVTGDQLRVPGILEKIQAAPEATNDNEIITRSIKLGYGNADTMVSNLDNLHFTPGSLSQNQVAGQTGPANSNQNQNSVNLTMFADKRTNSIIVSGPRAQVEEMARAINNIDTPEQTVRVRLRVEQVNLSDVQKLGINWSLGLAGVNVGQNSGNLTVGYAPNDLPANLSISLNTGKNHDNSKIIIDSNFAALSGQPTSFSNGGELLFPATTNVINGTTVNNPGQTYQYGLNIKVTPRIAPDGTVVMAMDTDLGSTPVSGPQSSIAQTKQTMSSTVMIKKGETVVLGGIVTNTVDNSKNGVPGLMDIPLLGALFGTKSNSNINQALLFIVSAEPISVTSSTNAEGNNGTQRTNITPSTQIPAVVTKPGSPSTLAAPVTPISTITSIKPATVSVTPSITGTQHIMIPVKGTQP